MLKNLKIDIHGASHSEKIGLRLAGIKKGENIDIKELQSFADRRKASDAVYSTSRIEPDELVFVSGIENGRTTGGDIVIEIKNTNFKKNDYAELKNIPRPSHADYPAFIKYSGRLNMSGGGPFSGRMTLPLCAAGGIAKQILFNQGITTKALVAEIGGINSDKGDMTAPILSAVKNAGAEGDSLGGIIEATAVNVPVGLGGPLFEGLESRLSALLFGIPAVKGIEFGSGFGITRMKGSEANDAYFHNNGKISTKTNNNGGIVGGMTNGMPVTLRVAIKPTPSISKPQDSVDLKTNKNVRLEIKGRHDVCIVPRAVVCVEAALALALLDCGYDKQQIFEDGDKLSELRKNISLTDAEILKLFGERMSYVKELAAEKQKLGKSINDPAREKEILEDITRNAPEEIAEYAKELYNGVFEISKTYQKNLTEKKK